MKALLIGDVSYVLVEVIDAGLFFGGGCEGEADFTFVIRGVVCRVVYFVAVNSRKGVLLLLLVLDHYVHFVRVDGGPEVLEVQVQGRSVANGELPVLEKA